MIRRLSVMSFVHGRAERRVDRLQAAIVEILAVNSRHRMLAQRMPTKRQVCRVSNVSTTQLPLKRTILGRNPNEKSSSTSAILQGPKPPSRTWVPLAECVPRNISKAHKV